MLLNLPHRVSRELLANPHLARPLVIGEEARTEGGQLPLQLFLGDGARAGIHDHRSDDPLAPNSIRNADDRDVLNRLVPAENILDLPRRNLESSALDEIDR